MTTISSPRHWGENLTNGTAAASPKQADILIALAPDELFHSPAPDADAFADLMIGGHRATYRVRGRDFRQWLRHQYFKKMKGGCNNDAMQVAVETIAAKAQFGGLEREVHCRVAEHDNAIYIDIGDATWSAIEITDTGWKVVDDPPVRFRRSLSTLPLPMPKSGALSICYGHSVI